MPFAFYYITQNVLEVTSFAMSLGIIEFYIHFIWESVGLNILTCDRIRKVCRIIFHSATIYMKT